MIYQNVPDTIKKLREQTGDSLHAMAVRAGLSYPTVHAWTKGKVEPNIKKWATFLNANGFCMKIVNKV